MSVPDIRIVFTTCGNCGGYVTQNVGVSGYFGGGSDLDFRPPPLVRNTMFAWLQRCAHCFYTARDITKRPANPEQFKSAAYLAAMHNERFPNLARRFMAHALVAPPEEAAHDYLCAAWDCDDDGLDEQAREARLLAAEQFAKLKPFDDGKKGMTTGATYVDVLRRSGQFDIAAVECQELLERKACDGAVRRALECQLRLIAEKDTACHLLSRD